MIKDEEDAQMLQNDLHKLYVWSDTINMMFNIIKVRTSAIWKCSGQGRLQSLSCGPLKVSYNSITRVLLSALASTEGKIIQAIKAIQGTFTCKITEVQHLN